jgi:hypothetical protein
MAPHILRPNNGTVFPVITNNPYRKALNTIKRRNNLNKEIKYYKDEIATLMNYIRNNPGGQPNIKSAKARSALSYQNALKKLERERNTLQGGKKTRKYR